MSAPTRQRLREYVAAAIRAELAWQGGNHTELARRLGWAQSYMQRRINGRVAFDTDDLEAIADALGVNVVKFLPREGGARNPVLGRYRAPAIRPTRDPVTRPKSVPAAPAGQCTRPTVVSRSPARPRFTRAAA